jgi:hypothetical protein
VPTAAFEALVRQVPAVAAPAVAAPVRPQRHHQNPENAAMGRLLIPALIVLNLALAAVLFGWLPGMPGDQPDPGRLARQVNPEQLKIQPAPPAPGAPAR